MSVDLAPVSGDRFANTCPDLSSELSSLSSMSCAICSSHRGTLGGCKAGHRYPLCALACVLAHGVLDGVLAGMEGDDSSMGHHGRCSSSLRASALPSALPSVVCISASRRPFTGTSLSLLPVFVLSISSFGLLSLLVFGSFSLCCPSDCFDYLSVVLCAPASAYLGL